MSRLKITDFNDKQIEVKSYRDSKRAKRIEWETTYTNFKIDTNPDLKQAVLPYLSPSNEELIVFFMGFEEYSFPNNVVIFDLHGEIISHLKIPALLSNEYKNFEKSEGIIEAQNSLMFLWPVIKKVNEKDVLAMCIRFNFDWYEIVELDPKTGKFGESLGATRQ